MKNMSKRILAMAFAVLMVISLMPAKPVSAASLFYQKNLTVYKGGTGTLYISNLPKGARLKSVKNSNPDVIHIENLGYNSYKVDGKTVRNAWIVYEAHSTGKANITFKVKNSKKTIKITVKPYENPVKSVEIFGTKHNNSTNLQNLTKNHNFAFVDLEGKQNSKNIKVVAAKGWKVSGIRIWSSTTENTNFNYYTYNGKGKGKVKLPGKGTYWMYVTMWNPKTDGAIDLTYTIYY